MKDKPEFAKFVSPVRHDQQNLGLTDTRLVFCNRKLMRTDILSLGLPNPYAIL